MKKHTVRTIVIKVLIAACMPLELKGGHLTACSTIPYVDFSEPSVIDMETHVNVSRCYCFCRAVMGLGNERAVYNQV